MVVGSVAVPSVLPVVTFGVIVVVVAFVVVGVAVDPVVDCLVVVGVVFVVVVLLIGVVVLGVVIAGVVLNVEGASVGTGTPLPGLIIISEHPQNSSCGPYPSPHVPSSSQPQLFPF